MTVSRQVGIEEAIRLAADGYRVLDVREPDEWAGGHIAGALHIPLAELPARATAELPDRAAPILVQCHSGRRSERAATWLMAQGYTDVVNLAGLIDRWPLAGGPWEGPDATAGAALEPRYARQVLVPGVGVDGQRRLAQARVLIVGAGGLGSPAALYLAAAGVGTLGIADDDIVEETNLHRQILHTTDRIGAPKVDSAAESIHELNPLVTVARHPGRVSRDNVERLIAAYDIVVDGSDSLETRYLVNDAAVRLRKPVAHAAVYRWEAQVTTLVPFAGPCYRCLYPTEPPDGIAAACDVAGVVGVLPGLAGVLQATEVIKLVLGTGEPLVGRMLLVDLAGTRFEEVAVQRDPACPACGTDVAQAAAG
ncbi:MAG TPA: molybdopterin-synthase adenylyltransferase MoeB [Candidatus Limnocylindria bacterium]|nr:molybdopterin-synthase adenylyltransferase MoeB [Candidatus Limnocylindria bacterium]